MFKIDDDDYMSIDEVSQMFGVESSTMLNWVSEGKIPSIKIGKSRIFHMQTINLWLKDKIEQ